MTRIVLLLLLLLSALPATAQTAPRQLPVDKAYSAISISGFDVQKMGLTMTIQRDAKGDTFKGFGNAGCNGWSAGVILREDQIDFTEIVTTRKFCGEPRMKAEEAFLTSLKSARRWRTDGDRLIIEGDAARLLLKASTPPAKR